MTIRVCVSVPPKTVEEAFDLIQRSEVQHADLIEVRLDSFTINDKIADIASCSTVPLIATIKPVKQHGKFSGTETERQKILIGAAKKGFMYVDVDLDIPNPTELIGNLHAAGAKVIVSFHDFDKTPTIELLNEILDAEIALGADVCKIITTARSMKDNLTTLNFVSEASKIAKIVCFAMGDPGKQSRLVSPIFGAFFTFACLDEKRKTAKGQLTIKEMNSAYEALGLK